jgi:serine/threonine-protein kinase RsbW
VDRLRLPAKLSSLGGFREFVRSSAEKAGVGASLLMKIELVLEELLVNHAMHAYGPEGGDSEVVCFCREPGQFCLRVIDDGPHFNPLQQSTPDVTLPPQDRPVGGLGIFLVRSMTDELNYQRDGDRNVMTACFLIKPKGDPG